MKRNIFFCLLFLGALASCEQEEFTGTGLEALSEFTLNPLSESTIELSSVNPEAELVITWNEAKSGLNSDVIYTWNAFEEGTSSSEVLISMESDNGGSDNQLTLTQEALDATLESLGLGTGESITLNWFVIATNGDVTKESETSTVTISRFVDEIALFDLLSPSDGTQLDLDIDNPSTQVVITWDSTYAGFGGAISYEWQADLDGGDFSDPVLAITSDNSGADFMLTLTHQQLDDALVSLGLAQGEVASLDWRVVASTVDLELVSSSVFSIDIRRFDSKVDFKIQLNSNEADVPSGFDVFVAGEFGKLGVAEGDWEQPGTNPDLQLTYNSTDGRYELNLRVPQGNIGTTFQFKYFLATTASPNWANGEQKFVSGGCGGAPNREVTLSAGGQITDDEVAVWEGFCPSTPPMRVLLNVTSNFPSSSDQDVYIAGAVGFVTWPQPGTDDRLKMTDIGGDQYEIFLPVPNGHNGEFKFFLATKQAPNWGQGEQEVNGTMDGCNGVGNRAFSYTGTESVTATVDVWEGFCPF
ncbi:MAG: SusE domain-containing protein [Fulvivirga sp.]